MKHIALLLFPYLICSSLSAQKVKTDDQDVEMIRKIYDEALARGESYQMLDFLTGQIGARLAGSPGAAAAVDWSKETMESFEFDNVFLQEVMVPHWVRGQKEIGKIVNSKMGSVEVNVVALGNSVGSGPNGVAGKIVEVQNFDELAALGEAGVKGKIVFFNRRMDPTLIETFEAYGGAGNQRGAGPSEAAKYGAIGVVVRSLTNALDDHPHTGSTNYTPNLYKLPAVAISTNDADRLSRMLKDDSELEFYFETHSQMLPDKLSHNVVGELKGGSKTDEYIVVGGHLDSWDLAQGAHDDGTGCVQSIEVLRILKAIGYKPKRTLRAVMFMNEENGLRGGRKYAELAAENKEKHIAAMESDRGGFKPLGFTFTAEDKQVERIKGWAPLFVPYQIYKFDTGGGGADIRPLATQGVPMIGFYPDPQRYFDYHHTAIDTFDKVSRRELELGAATMAALTYLIDKYGL
ncbi:M20/M25/M40 family metallo-hydrolase [uncultured Imperialibacter sp.]|uniref:M20/M25/M40 family metallo-hydrolase n=1 Tax=uncultured Imperialibacter sp. TaxID=1672639 RepID=UPI0030DA3975